MERSTKHRILGIIVMAALVIALLPLFRSSNNTVKLEPQLVNTPPFHDQSAQANDNSNPEFKMALASQTSPIPIKNSQDSESAFNQQPDDTINPSTSQAYNHLNKQAPAEPQASAAVAKSVPAVDDDNDSESVLSAAEPNNDKKAAKAVTPATVATPDSSTIFRNSLETELQAAAKPVVKKAARQTKVRELAPKTKQAQLKRKQLPLDNNGLFKLKTSAWVIQLGSYNKPQALKLVNRLRANGYSAFIQEASIGTSVYVGPEAKEGAARSVANRLAYEMKIQGVVISYKPLTL